MKIVPLLAYKEEMMKSFAKHVAKQFGNLSGFGGAVEIKQDFIDRVDIYATLFD
ncbi:MAG: hypothetical protein LBV74_10040 [Tannerella sp.]|nr:hypothetical protein [Tannerella sp.]